MKKHIIKFLSIILILFALSCNDDGDNNSSELSQFELLTKSRWSFKEDGIIDNNEFVPDEAFECSDRNFIKFLENNTFYESDFELTNNVCIDLNIDNYGAWEIIENNILKTTYDGDTVEFTIKQLDLNNLILSESQINEEGNPEIYYIYYTR